jgi:hypothetical protein
MILHPGQHIDRFVVERALGEGGMATVYRVRHVTLEARYALKILSIPSPAIRDRMLREGRFQATLRHTNIVSVIDVLDIHGMLGLLMEYVEGPSLAEWLAEYRPELREALAVFGGILSAVDMVHARGIIHRDLKPANVLLHLTDEGLYPRVTDFGIAKSDRFSDISTGSGATIGTPAYMAPEQFKDASNVDQRADIFSLGAILYELVTGRRAFKADNMLALMNDVARGEFVPPEKLVPGLPEGIKAAIYGALRPDPEQRIGDCRQLAAVLTGQTAVHNIGDAMQRRLFRSAAGTRAAERLIDDRRRREAGDTGAPFAGPAPDRTFGQAPQRVDLPPEMPFDEVIGVDLTEDHQRAAAPRMANPTVQPAILLMFLLVGALGLLGGVVIAMISSAQVDGPVRIAQVDGPAPSPTSVFAEAPRPATPTPAPGPGDPQPAAVAVTPAPAPPAPDPPPRPSPAPAVVVHAVAPDPVPSRVHPVPIPAPVPVVEVPAPRTGRVEVSGDADAVRLVGSAGEIGVGGAVPVGTYRIRARFGDAWHDAGSVEIRADATSRISCDGAFLICRGG